MAGTSGSIAHHRARVAALTRACRNGERPQADLDEARRAMAEAQIEQYVRRVVAEAPPLTDAQRERLADLFRAGRSGGGGAA
ncbi:hypothetical protein [Mycobacterium sp. 155]|uniref:hypothetical protein n=1 Tax=Mycobacterium sp. 155 TaxID=1157943 RepID=UPI00036114C2|nr:hypothetical protein [Mycobacterium sp. 155]